MSAAETTPERRAHRTLAWGGAPIGPATDLMHRPADGGAPSLASGGWTLLTVSDRTIRFPASEVQVLRILYGEHLYYFLASPRMGQQLLSMRYSGKTLYICGISAV